MPIDFYFRMPEDPNYSSYETEVAEELDQFLQQVEMILTTRKGQVLGEPKFGANLEDFLWNYRASSYQIENEVKSQIETWCSELGQKFSYKVEASFIPGDISDSILVDITIDGTKVLGIGVRP